MVIFGIDPGYAIVGCGVVRYERGNFSLIGYGAVTTDKDMPFNKRLKKIYDDLTELLLRFKPDAVSMERLYFNTNQKTAIDVAQARGVAVLAVENAGIPLYEYTPLQVKQSIVGYGRAEKIQVQNMTKMFLKLDKIPKPDDAADALALAVCHGHASGSLILGGK
ncbi:MAG: crossover junction endodeoxyribonuclease RuvC [Oscillospiraceae bacterium]|nr:crossover junction endodeoxyribonuclease RuvC [Oscillospiraceae bacterium]